jgi:hypothetical protein
MVIGTVLGAADAKPLVIDPATGRTVNLPAGTGLIVSAATTANASLTLPVGVAPTSPTDGQMWLTTAGLFVRANGSTVGPLSAGTAGGITGTLTSGRVPFANGTSTVTDSAQMLFSTANGLSLNRSATSNCEFVGSAAGNATTTTTDSTALGNNALHAITSATNCTAVGSAALSSGTTAVSNGTAVGYRALYQMTAAADCTAIGSQSMANWTNGGGDTSTAVGSSALKGSGVSANNTGNANTAVGYRALFANSTGLNNVAIGASAGVSNDTGSSNVFIGNAAGDSTAVGASNRFVSGSTLSPITSVFFGNGETNGNPSNVTIQTTSCVTGTANHAGSNLTLLAGVSTGNVTGGSIIFKTSPAGSVGSTPNTATTAMTIAGVGDVSVSTATESTSITTGAITDAGGLGVTKRSWLGDTTNTSFSGNVIAGVRDGTGQTSGQVGEIQTATFNGGTGATTVCLNVQSLSLTRGCWLLTSFVNITSGTTGLTSGSTIKWTFGTSSGVDGSPGSTASFQCVPALQASNYWALDTPPQVVNISANTTYYGNLTITYAGGTPGAIGILMAQRLR